MLCCVIILHLPVTTDVSHANALLNCPSLHITCHFVPGSLAQGCSVSFLPSSVGSAEPQETTTELIPRHNSSLEATAVLMLSHQSCCHQLLVYDWEAEGSVGHIPVPLENTGMEFDRSCGPLASSPTSSDDGNSGTVL